MKKTLFAAMLAAALTLSAVTGALAAGYTDVPEDAWYAQSVNSLTDKGIMSGVGDGLFAPDRTMTRAEALALLYKLDGNKLADADPWYAPAREWAMTKKISDGENMTSSVTRQEFAVLLYRLAGMRGYDVNLRGDGSESFADASKVASWAKKGLDWAVNAGLLQGYNGNIMPQRTLTRAEAAAFVSRFYNAYMKQ